MKELTDLEICKRIAEIEGCIDIHENNGNIWHKKDYETLKYNPLTDDALCFQLMIKYKVDLFNGCVFEKAGGAYAVSIAQSESGSGMPFESHDKPANKAICLVIIEANK